MAQVRYAVVFGYKDTADRFLSLGEIYLRNSNLDQAKILFKTLPREMLSINKIPTDEDNIDKFRLEVTDEFIEILN